jgi:Chaperone of endosialidase
MTTLHLRKSVGFLLIALTLAWFALSPRALAVSPAPDGGYANGNTAEGTDALFNLTTGNDNTAVGLDALYNNTTGDANAATGSGALSSNTTGFNNTANGASTLQFNTTGLDSTATGFEALQNNSSGNNNTATGVQALTANTIGNSNTADGFGALSNNASGNNNIALGNGAGQSLTTGDNNIDIGNTGVAAEANTIRIGTVGTQTNAFMAGIFGVTVTKGVSVVIDSTGHLGTKGSSERFKDAIKPMDKASEAILALKPVTFHYKKELDPEGIPQFGLIAEQVEKGQSRSGGSRRPGKGLYGALRCGERDAAKRVPQRASQGSEAGSWDGSSRRPPERAGGANPESERPA